jgi:xanthine dehydrogenase YagS FAD-binding subunit
MVPYRFIAVDDERSAHASAAPEARYLAGGTTLIDLVKLHVERPAAIVDINRLPLSAITALPDGGVRVGALVRNSDMAHHPLIRERYPMLSQAILAGASPQLRNMATTGGNLLQRTRCYYFRDTTQACNKRDPGSGCGALDGFNRIHAVLGGSDRCIATHPSDMCVPLAALDAVVVISGAGGSRRVPVTDFHLLPGEHPERESVLEPGDLITAVDIPAVPYAARSTYVKVRDRNSYAFALASAAVALDVADGVVRAARVALGGVGTKPWRAWEAERVLVGSAANETTFRTAADAALAGAVARAHNAFKIELAKRTIVRACRRAGALE